MATDPLVRNNVTLAGNPTAAKAIVFVNGLGYDQSFWRHVTPSFANDYRLILFDNVGSVPSNQPYFREKQHRYLNVSGYAADLLEICAALDLGGDTVLVGHSLGAVSGLLASIQSPSRFCKLVLLGVSPRYTDAEDYRGGFSLEDIHATYSAIQNNYRDWSAQIAAAAMATPDRSYLNAAFAETLARIPQEMMLTIMCSVLQMDHRSSLARVCVPTLIIQSTKDYFVPMEVAHYVHAHIANSALTVIGAMGHLPHVSAPDEVAMAIKRFIG